MPAPAFRKWHVQIGKAALVAVVYCAAWYAGYLQDPSAGSSIQVRFASGVAVAAVLLFGAWMTAPLVLLTFVLEIVSGGAPSAAALESASIVLQTLPALACPRRHLRLDLERIRDVILLLVVAPGIGALAGAGVSAAAGEWPRVLLVRWAQNASGILALAPLLLTWWVNPRFVGSKKWTREGLSCLAVIAFMTAAVYSHLFAGIKHVHLLAFLPIPFAVWAVFRLGQKGASAVSFLTCLAVVHETPVVPDYSSASLFSSWPAAWMFIGMFSLALHALASLASDRKWVAAMTLERERYFEKLIESTSDIVTILEANGTIRYESPSIQRMLGYHPEELLGRSVFDLVHPDDLPTALRALAEAIPIPGAERAVECRFLHKNGQWRSLETHGVNLLHDPSVRGIVLNTRDQTERRMAQRKLEEQFEFLRALIDTVPSPIFYKDNQGIYLGCNQAFERLIGKPRQEIVGKSVYDISTPELADRYKRADDELLACPGRQVYESEVRGADGSVREAVFYKATFGGASGGPPAGIVGAALDITEIKAAERRLMVQSAALEAAANAIVIVDRSGNIQWANPAFTRTTGYSVEEVRGQNPRILKSGKHDQDFYRNLWETILAGRVWSGELVNRRKDGSLYPEEMTITPVLDGAGVITHFIAIKQEITDRKNLEKQFLQAQKMEAVGRLAGGIAHDFNNLLTVIIGYCELAAGHKELSEAVRVNLTEIRKASRRAVSLTDQLLAFSKHQMTQPQVLEIDHVIREMVDMLRRIVGDDVVLRTHLAHQLAPVKVDLSQLEQVIMNLVVNARDAMPQGGTIHISTEALTPGAEVLQQYPEMVPGRYVALKVRDTGSGMTEEVRAHLYEPFFTTKPKSKGTGLGLATVYGIVKNAKGHIFCDSEPGKGTTFTICFPECGESPAAVSPRESPAASSAQESHKTLVLVAEDEEPVRRLICEILTQHGFEVCEASNGVEALLRLKRMETKPDALLTDIVMPEMGGQDLILRVRAMFPGMRIVAMSAYADGLPEIQERFLKDGEIFIKKPFVSDQLIRTLTSALTAPGADKSAKQ